MIRVLILIIVIIICECGRAQTIPANETELESTIVESLVDPDADDTRLLQIEYLKKAPINLNEADVEDLKELLILSPTQIHSFFTYRRIFGDFLSIYELQAVPNWDIETINSIRSFIKISKDVHLKAELKSRMKAGQHMLLTRVSQIMERTSGQIEGKLSGGPQKMLVRYKYSFKNLLQFGLLAEKDPGEPIGKGNPGFDFYSAFIQANNIKRVKSLILGDFIINMGQGLIHWQGLGFRKSPEVLSIKRQSTTIIPYNSAGEFYFNRGLAVSLKAKNLITSFFVSNRKLSATIDGTTSESVGSFHTSGLHRTSSEILKKRQVSQLSAGATVSIQKLSWQVSANTVYYKFSKPLQPNNDPYALFAISGSQWYNASIDYGFTKKNFHVFGEIAVDKNMSLAILKGILASLDPRVDISFLIRRIPSEYKALYGSAFTDNTTVSNENGSFFGLQIRPNHRLKISLYSDWFQFPWLKYRVHAPSTGHDLMFHLNYIQSKNADWYMRWNFQRKEANVSDEHLQMVPIQTILKTNWRTHVNFKLNRSITIRSRVELCSIKDEGGRKNGFLAFADIIYKPNLKPYDIIFRWETFEADNYDTRVYTYENDVQYSYSIPALYDVGNRYYILIKHELNSKIAIWLRYAQTIYNSASSLGTGIDEISGNKKTEIKLQIRYLFQ